MTDFWKAKRVIFNAAAAALVLAGACGYLLVSHWLDSLVAFRDVTVELGTETLAIAEFMTGDAWGSQVDFVTDYRTVDLGQVGQRDITLSHFGREQTVKLTVQDTTAPRATIETHRVVEIDNIPQASELVSQVEDASPVTIRYAQEPVVSVDYSDVTVEVIVEDSSGNQLRQECVFSYRWFREKLTLELGQQLTSDMLLLNPQRDQGLLNQTAVSWVNKNGVGSYQVTAMMGDEKIVCDVTVEDTTPPDLELKPVSCGPGGYVTMERFVVSATDRSGRPKLRLVGTLPSTRVKGKHTIIIEAEDAYGNVSREETVLTISENTVPPRITGTAEPLTIEKGSQPDFLKGVTAQDEKDGKVAVTVDTRRLDVNTPGTYYITYSAQDSSGNQAVKKRMVEVLHDEADTAALVRQIADSLSNDPEEIRDYVRSTIGYSTNFGGEDPVWFGFTRRTGNCYVHALCLQELLEFKGYETKLIWVTNESHYWLLINLGGTWRHIDATPGINHSRFSLMTDKQRLNTLSGRKWDTTQWPACE